MLYLPINISLSLTHAKHNALSNFPGDYSSILNSKVKINIYYPESINAKLSGGYKENLHFLVVIHSRLTLSLNQNITYIGLKILPLVKIAGTEEAILSILD